MKKKMAFVDLTNYKDWPMGGMLEYELQILRFLVEHYDVDIYGISVDEEKNKEITINGRKYPIHIWGNALTKRRLIPNYWRGLELLHYKSFAKDYDIVYAHTGSCIVALYWMINRKKTKLVYHQHGLNHVDDKSLKSLIQRPGLWMAQKMADLVYVVSDEESVAAYRKKMKKKTKAHFIAIGSPIDLEKYNVDYIKQRILEKKNKVKTFIYTGRLTKFKNVSLLVSAMKLYVENIDSEACLFIVGDGEEYNNLRMQICSNGLEKNVFLKGRISHDEIKDLLLKSDIFVTASGGEGVSVSVLEAFASGLPVVCLNVTGLKKQVIDGKTGILVKDDDANSFCDGMLAVKENYYNMAINCMNEVKKYDSQRIAKKIIDGIDSLIEMN